MQLTEIEPYAWQKPLVDKVAESLERDRMFISGFPTGAGKTVIDLAAAKRLGRPHLVIAPKAALTQWRRMAEAMGAADNLVDVINPESVSKPRGCAYYTRAGLWKLPAGTLVTWDEPHRSASGVDSVSTRALAELKAFSGVRLHAMSATLADSPLKLRALGLWGGLHNFCEASFYDWCRSNGCRLVETGGRMAFKFKPAAGGPPPAEIMAKIRRDFGTRFMALKPSEIPGFPETSVSVKLVDLASRSRAELDAAYASLSERVKAPARSRIAQDMRDREKIEHVMADVLAENAASWIEDGRSVVTFFNFTEPRLRFEAALKALGHDTASVYGGQKEEDRQGGIDAFQANRVFSISVMAEAGGAALSLHDVLQERQRVSQLVPAYNAPTVKQCLGRIQRCGGTYTAQHFVLAAGTVQERVAAAMNRKLVNLDAFNGAFGEEGALAEEDLLPV